MRNFNLKKRFPEHLSFLDTHRFSHVLVNCYIYCYIKFSKNSKKLVNSRRSCMHVFLLPDDKIWTFQVGS